MRYIPGDCPTVYNWIVSTLYIKNPVAHELARKVSKKLGVTLTEAVIRSLQDQLHDKPRPIDWDKVDAISREIAALPVLDSRTDDEILGYDEFGIPR
jgi:antitoxin VapB